MVCQLPLCVLIADDDRDAADTTAMLVRRWGHEARVAYDGAAAQDAAFASRPDVALLDVGMPRLDGIRLARRLRQSADFRGTLLVAVSGYHDPVTRAQSLQAGFDGYLVKPADPELLGRLLTLRRELKQLEGVMLEAGSQTGELIRTSAGVLREMAESLDDLNERIRRAVETLRQGRPQAGERLPGP